MCVRNITNRLVCPESGANACNSCQFGKIIAEIEKLLKFNSKNDESYGEYKIRIEGGELRHDDLCELILDKKYSVRLKNHCSQ